MRIQELKFLGQGMSRVYENEKWTVGIKNWKPASDIKGIDCLERHNQTDELFVLLSGECQLLYANEINGELKFDVVKMEPMQVYNIPAALWHNAIMTKETKMVLVEDCSTGAENSDTLLLTNEQKKTIEQLLKYN